MTAPRIYTGPRSTVGLPGQGVIDTDREVALNIFATAFDSLNGRMFTREKNKMDPASINEIKGRFLVLKRIAKKKAPEKMGTLNRLEKIALDRARGRITDKEASQQIRVIIHQQKQQNPYLPQIEAQLRMKEQQFDMQNTAFAKNVASLQKKAKKQKKPQPLLSLHPSKKQPNTFQQYVKNIQKESPLAKLWQDPKKGRRK